MPMSSKTYFKAALVFALGLPLSMAGCTVEVQHHDASLKSLGVSAGSLSFKSELTEYSVVVPAGTTILTLTPTANDESASITVTQRGGESAPVASGAPLDVTVPAPGAFSTITITVTSQDTLASRAYTIVLSQVANHDPALKGLTLSAGSLSPTFAPATTSYTATVPFGTTSVTMTPTANDTGVGITLSQDGSVPVAVPSGSATASLTVPAVGKTTSIVITATAQDGITLRSYAIVLGQTVSHDATLKSLTLSAGALSPAFAAATTSYTVSVPRGATSLTVTPTATGAGSTITVALNTGTPAAVASGSPSAELPAPAEGASSTVTIVVTAQDKTTTKTYTIVTSLPANNDASLQALTDSTGRPADFLSGTLSYAYTVPFQTGDYRVTATATNPDVKSITVNGTAVPTGTASGPIALQVGAPTAIVIVVTAKDGTTKATYTLNVTEAAERLNVAGLVTPRTVSIAPSVPLAVTSGDTLPKTAATQVPVDTLLRIGFDSAPTIGTSGSIRIARAVDDVVVDTINLADHFAIYDGTSTIKLFTDNLPPPVGTNTKVNVIGGLTSGVAQVRVVNYLPVMVSGNTATIYPHNNKLAYGTEYSVTIDASVLSGTISSVAFGGISSKTSWTFKTKDTAPTTFTVAADNTADYATVQGAIDAAPLNGTVEAPTVVSIAGGVYQEMLFVAKKQYLTLKGAGTDGVATVIQYDNCDGFNPGTGSGMTVTTPGATGTLTPITPSGGLTGGGRALLLVGSGTNGLVLDSITLKSTHAQGATTLINGLDLAGAATYKNYNSSITPAEVIYFNASTSNPTTAPNQLVAKHSNFVGSQQVLQLKGWSWFYDSFITGDTDIIWGAAYTALFERCELKSRAFTGKKPSMVQSRANGGYGGFVFLRSALTKEAGAYEYLARSNGASTSGFDNVAFISCAMDSHVPAVGWDAQTTLFANQPGTAVAGWREYDSATLDGIPVDLSGRLTATASTNGAYLLNSTEAMTYYPSRATIFRGASDNGLSYLGITAGWDPQP